MRSILFHNVQRFGDGRWEHVDLLVARGRIKHLAVSGSTARPTASHVFDWPKVCVLPGLINAHDHLELNLLPRLGRGPYANSYEWSHSIYRPQEPPMAEVLAIPLRDRLIMGGYKNLLCGVTTVCHHNPYHRRVFGRRFPVKVVRGYRWAHSLGFGEGLGRSFRAAGGTAPWIIHAAEGTDDRAASEIAALAARGLLAGNTVIVHGVAMQEQDIALLEQHGTSLIWCPSSNSFLLGATAPVDKLLDRVPIALGSDSTLSADGDLLDELRAAAGHRLWPQQRLIELVTTSAARVLRLQDGRGGLTCGGPADLLFIPAGAADPSAALLATHSKDIQLVMRDGVPGYGNICAMGIFESKYRGVCRVCVDGADKLVAGPFENVLERVTRTLGRANFFGHEISPVSG